MTDQRPPSDATGGRRPGRATRRRVLAGLGASAAALAGCIGDGRTPKYDERTVDASGAGRNASEMSAAQAVAEQEVDRNLTPLEGLSVTSHEFVLEDDYRGATVQGTVENTRDGRVQSAEVRVRVRNDQGRHLGRYVASTGDLDPGTTWQFQVVLLESPDDIASYDIAAVGMSA